MNEALIEALLAERAGYVRRGLPDRVAAVDAELVRLGAQPPADAPPAAVVEEADAGTDPQPSRRGRRKAED